MAERRKSTLNFGTPFSLDCTLSIRESRLSCASNDPTGNEWIWRVSASQLLVMIKNVGSPSSIQLRDNEKGPCSIKSVFFREPRFSSLYF
jgi:hypothetical protein